MDSAVLPKKHKKKAVHTQSVKELLFVYNTVNETLTIRIIFRRKWRCRKSCFA